MDSIPVINKQTGEQPNYFGLPQVRENCGVELRVTHLADDDVAFSSFSASRIYQVSERGVPLVLTSITVAVSSSSEAVSYTHLTLPTTPYV